MNEIMNMENEVPEVQQKGTEKIIDEIQNIVLLEKSKVSEEIIADNDIHECTLEKKTVEINDEQRSTSEDENENTLSNGISEKFYKNAQQYWKSIPATVDGMLGGFSNINVADIRGSQDFMKEVFKMKPSPSKERALDCGAGMFLFS